MIEVKLSGKCFLKISTQKPCSRVGIGASLYLVLALVRYKSFPGGTGFEIIGGGWVGAPGEQLWLGTMRSQKRTGYMHSLS